MTLRLGYARVSTIDQRLDLQLDDLVKAGVERDRIYTDIASGKTTARPGLEACLKALQPGNVLMVWKLDRLGRNIRDLIGLADDLQRRGVAFVSLKDGIDTSTTIGQFTFHLLAALAQMERALLIERTQAGLAAAKARGRTGGRPFALQGTALDVAVHSTQTDKELGELLHVHPATIYRARRRAKLQARLPASPTPSSQAQPSKAEAAD